MIMSDRLSAIVRFSDLYSEKEVSSSLIFQSATEIDKQLQYRIIDQNTVPHIEIKFTDGSRSIFKL